MLTQKQQEKINALSEQDKETFYGSEKLRKIIERKKDNNYLITNISTQKETLFETDSDKTISAIGLSSVALSYVEDELFKVAIVCLDDVNIINFKEIL